jgi:hypothetical protein
MQYTTIATTLLALASSTVAAPTPQVAADSVCNCPSTGTTPSQPATSSAAPDKSGVFVDPGRVGVGLSKLDNSDGLTFLFDQDTLAAGMQDTRDVVQTTLYEKVEIALGDGFANKDLRCQLIDLKGNTVFATRGTNLDDTFSDADKGFWKLVTPTQIDTIVCNSAFKANNRNPAA